jgi:cell division septum initiation protein DivIVA
VALAPDAYTPRISRARERVKAALDAAAAGDTAAAIARYAEAEEEALEARNRAADDTARVAEATEFWAGIALDRAGLMLAGGATPWYRGDNDQMLTDALAIAQRVRAAPVSPPTRQRADELNARIERQLRTGPLEWLPRR